MKPSQRFSRFVAPEDYGILSAPVEHVLGVKSSASAVEKYIGYVQDLRFIRDSRGFRTAAEVDMALWTLQVGVLLGGLGDGQKLKEDFHQDQALRSIRVKNLASRLFDEMERIDLAEALTSFNVDLAGQLAALEFEQVLRRFAKATSEEELAAIITRMAPSDLHGKWQRCRVFRNRAVHGIPLRQKEVEEVVLTTRDIIARNSQRSRRKP